MTALTFSEEGHIYTLDGRVIPSVTGCISEWRLCNVYGRSYYINNFTGQAVREEVFAETGDFGTAVHTMIRLHIEGDLDRGALDPLLEGVLTQFEEWAQTYKVDLSEVNKPGALSLCERPMYSAKYGYAGTPDLICPVMGKMAVVDFKTGFYTMAGPQLAAYEQLYRENVKSMGLKKYVLSLSKDGESNKNVPMTEKTDWQFFKSRLTTRRLLLERGIAT